MATIRDFGTRTYLRENKLGLWALESRVKVLQLQQQNARAIRRIYLEASKDLASQISGMAEGLHKEALQTIQRSLDVSAASVGLSLKQRLTEDIAKTAALAMDGTKKPLVYGLQKAGALIPGSLVTASGISKMYASAHELAVLAQWARTANGLTLSERIWSTAAGFRSELKDLIDLAVAEGWGAKKTAGMIEVLAEKGGSQLKKTILADYPNAAARLGKGFSKNTNWEALRLARTELNFAYNEATIIAGQMTPGYIGAKWELSAMHPIVDICDDYATDDHDGLGPGCYKAGNEPIFAHPNCLCYLTPLFEDRETWIKGLSDWVKGGDNPEMDKWYQEVYQGNE